MAIERRIIVEIVDTQIESDNVVQENNEKKNPAIKKNSKSKALAKMFVDNLVDISISSAENSLNRYFAMSENYMAETDYKNTMNVIKNVKSLASTVANPMLMAGSSLSTGGMGGFSGSGAASAAGAAGSASTSGGAAWMSIISAASWLGNQIISYQQKLSGYYQNLNATIYQTEFDRTRMGLINEGKGTEN